MASSSQTTDHAQIKEWADKHNGVPAVIEETANSNDSRMLRIHFPDKSDDNNTAEGSGEANFREISWDTFFDTFEQRSLALLTSSDDDSTFHKFVARNS